MITSLCYHNTYGPWDRNFKLPLQPIRFMYQTFLLHKSSNQSDLVSPPYYKQLMWFLKTQLSKGDRRSTPSGRNYTNRFLTNIKREKGCCIAQKRIKIKKSGALYLNWPAYSIDIKNGGLLLKIPNLSILISSDKVDLKTTSVTKRQTKSKAELRGALRWPPCERLRVPFQSRTSWVRRQTAPGFILHPASGTRIHAYEFWWWWPHCLRSKQFFILIRLSSECINLSPKPSTGVIPVSQCDQVVSDNSGVGLYSRWW